MCGKWGSFYCTGKRWFDFMGSTSNGLSPFNIKYIYDKEPEGGFMPFNKTVTSCSEGIPLKVCLF